MWHSNIIIERLPNRYLNIVQYLADKGADINSEDISKTTPLSYATSYGHLNIVQYLTEKGAKRIPYYF